jgi:UPF0755 protein
MLKRNYFFLGLILTTILSGMLLVYQFVYSPLLPGSEQSKIIRIPSGTDFKGLLKLLEEEKILANTTVFSYLSKKMNFKDGKVKSGQYKINKGNNLIQLIRKLRAGMQEPVNVVLTTERMPENIAAKVSTFIEPDSITLNDVFNVNEIIGKEGFTKENFQSLFIPNTYQMYWNTSASSFLSRMKSEYDSFWASNQRKEKASALSLSPQEVYTLASIVEKETQQNIEKKRIAGVYLNRLKIGMPLQADPTAVFARKDFLTRRVTDYHTKFDSPYNTYKYTGLPPGPITMSSISSIDAVLNYEKHNYLYFCAVGDESGLHSFATDLSEHNRNARKYRDNLIRRGLR